LATSFEVADTTAPGREATLHRLSRRVYLRDFAKVIDGTEEKSVAFLNKTPAVKVSIQKQPEANTITVVGQTTNSRTATVWSNSSRHGDNSHLR